MPYTVIRPFKDMRDEEQHEYQIDDVFPRKGYEPDQEPLRKQKRLLKRWKQLLKKRKKLLRK